jgi:hypothetical protein
VCIQWLEGKTTAMMHAEARARIAELEREQSGLLAAVLKAVADEPECPDSMPDEMWMAMAEHKDVAEEAVRIAVRHTKAGIHDRIVEAISPAQAAAPDDCAGKGGGWRNESSEKCVEIESGGQDNG